jgi:hypothetical protein
MHATISLPLFAWAARELLGPGAKIPQLKEFNAVRDSTILSFLEMLRRELSEEETASPSFVQGIAQVWRRISSERTAMMKTRALIVPPRFPRFNCTGS